MDFYVIKPMTELMRYLEHHNDDNSGYLKYQIPLNWQPWFARVKAIFAKNEHLVISLQNANQKLDDQVRQQSQKLKHSDQAKGKRDPERHDSGAEKKGQDRTCQSQEGKGR